MTRRDLLSLFPSALALGQQREEGKKTAAQLPTNEFLRYLDPTTENLIVRLTDPAHTSLIPASQNHFMSSRRGFLLFTSNRTGQFAPFQVDLRNGKLRQLAETKQLDPKSVTLDPQEKNCYFVDGGVLKFAQLSNLRPSILAEGIKKFHVSGTIAAVLRDQRIDFVSLGSKSKVLATQPVPAGFQDVLMRPGGAGCLLVRKEASLQEFWYFPREKTKPILLMKGQISCPFWRPDGATLLFLRARISRYVSSEIQEISPESLKETLVGKTSQFAEFAPNSDATAFVGASRSKAQPHILLLLRSAQREFTLCEHKAGNPEFVSPAFSPNSQRVYFQSDRSGNPALYSVNVEKMIEVTPDD